MTKTIARRIQNKFWGSPNILREASPSSNAGAILPARK